MLSLSLVPSDSVAFSVLIEIQCISIEQEAIMAATTTMVHVRVDEQIKAQATETLAAMGLTVSDAVRVFLTRVVTDQAFPFELKAPNAQSIKAMAEAQDIIASRQARFESADALINDLEKNSSK